MKVLIRVAVACAAIVVIALGALAILLPRIVKSEAVRARIESAAYDALGRELRYRDLDVGLLPPALEVVGASVAGATPEAEALLEARQIALRVALMPLLARAVVIDSLVVEGARIRLVRTTEGLELPVPAGGGADGKEPRVAEKPSAGDPAPADEVEEGSPVAIALREVALRDASVVLEDRSVEPAVTWELRDIDVTARGESLDAPIDLDASFALGSGGSIEARGTATLAGDLDVTIELTDLALAPARPYLGESAIVEGRLGGTVSVKGPAADPDLVAIELSLSDALLTLDDITLRGPVAMRADVGTAVTLPTGRFELDASDAELRYGEVFTKPPGTRASVSGRIVSADDGTLGIEDVELAIKNLDATAKVSAGTPVRVVASTNSFDLAGWEELVPALADAPLSGNVRVQDIELVSEPLDLRGAIHLEELTASLPDLAPVTLSGTLHAEGDAVRTRGLAIVAAEQTFTLDAALLDLFGTPAYEAELAADDADVNALSTAFAASPDTLHGPLDLRGSVRGTLGERPPLETLQGDIEFGIEKGRLVGVSLLEATFDKLGALGSLGSAAVDAGRVFGGRDLQALYGDEFEIMSGKLHIADGVVHAKPFAMVYRGYGADLGGTIGLTDLSLEMEGRLKLFESTDAILARNAGAPDSYQPTVRTIPLAGVGGTLDAPEVRVARSTATDFAAAYAKDIYVGKLKKVVEDELGEGTGDLVDQGLGALEGLFGRSRR
jgi:hypothetical protein